MLRFHLTITKINVKNITRHDTIFNELSSIIVMKLLYNYSRLRYVECIFIVKILQYFRMIVDKSNLWNQTNKYIPFAQVSCFSTGRTLHVEES